MDKATWHLMDIGWSGVYMGLVYAIHGIIVLVASKSKWRTRLSVLKANLMQSYIMDQLPVVLITLGNASREYLDTSLRKLSYLTSIAFILIFTYEFMRQYFEVERMSKLKKEERTEYDKKLGELYFDGICKEEISTNWFVRHFNLLFTLKFVFIGVIIVSMQYQQVFIQVLSSFVVTLSCLVINIRNFSKFKIFKSKLTKYLRMVQDASFTLMMLMIFALYVDEKSRFLNEFGKMLVVYIFVALVLINLVIEVTILLKEIFGSCCKKKTDALKINQIEPEKMNSEFEDQLEVRGAISEIPKNKLQILDSEFVIQSNRYLPGQAPKLKSDPESESLKLS